MNYIIYQRITVFILFLYPVLTNIGQVQKYIFPDKNNSTYLRDKKPLEYIYKSDTLSYEIWVNENEGTEVEFYSCYLVTHVCRTKKCEIAKLIIHFDLTGQYMSFDTVQGAPLTKKDHKPFFYSDYKKLDGLLADKNSILMNYSLNKFDKAIVQKHIDGVTGATPQILKREIIEGAAYTSYTLWHLVNNTLSGKTQDITRQKLDENLVIKVLKQKENHFIEWTLHELKEKPFQQEKYLHELLQIITKQNNYIAKLAVSTLTDSMLNSPETQHFVIENYRQISFFIKTLLLKRYAKIKTTHEYIHQLLSFYKSSLPFHKLLLLSIIENNEGFKPDNRELAVFAEDLNNSDNELAGRVYNYLYKLTDLPKQLKHDLKQFRKENKL